MMNFLFKQPFLKRFQSYSLEEQQIIRMAILQIKEYLYTRSAPYGLRIKLLHRKGAVAVYEARATIELRIVYTIEGNVCSFNIIGNHDEVRRFIHGFR